MYIVNVYMPSALSPDNYGLYLKTLTLDLLDKKLIICGDFNCLGCKLVIRDNDASTYIHMYVGMYTEPCS